MIITLEMCFERQANYINIFVIYSTETGHSAHSKRSFGWGIIIISPCFFCPFSALELSRTASFSILSSSFLILFDIIALNLCNFLCTSCKRSQGKHSGTLLTTLHPLLENVLQTVDHFEISCLGAPFSWLEKPRNRMGRGLNWILCSAWKKWICGTLLEHPPYSPTWLKCEFFI
jgi:hypothetical protein